MLNRTSEQESVRRNINYLKKIIFQYQVVNLMSSPRWNKRIQLPDKKIINYV